MARSDIDPDPSDVLNCSSFQLPATAEQGDRMNGMPKQQGYREHQLVLLAEEGYISLSTINTYTARPICWREWIS